MNNHRPPRAVVYGVFEVPRYMAEERTLDSVWSTEQAARSRAVNRSYGVHGQVHLMAWRMDDTAGRQHLGTYVDGELIPGRAAR
jgi:hypothetical protein